MATQMTPPAAEAKQKFSLSVKYQKADGSWAVANGEKDFTLPENVGSIDVKYTANDGSSQKTETRKFERSVVANVEELLAAIQANPLAEIAARNYGYDLFHRNIIKAPIGTEMEGPGKTLLKMAENLIASRQKLGKSEITLERALEIVKATMED